MGLARALALGSGRETGAVGEAVPGAPSSLNCALQGWNLKGQPGDRWCRCQPADTGLAGQARPRKDGFGGHPPEDSGSEVQPGVQLGGTKTPGNAGDVSPKRCQGGAH